jgi:23S rRNA (uracil1939-C5)-methyltransferase
MDNLAKVESLNHDGQGVAHVEGKTIFIDGALPYEIVHYSSYRKKPSFEKAQIRQLVKESFIRTTPRCLYFGTCGGCSIQHLDSTAQVAIKQRVLEDTLLHIGKAKPELILPPIYGTSWGYRHRARISARYVMKKEKMLVGFHEKRSAFVADMQTCEVLPPHVSALLMPLRSLIRALSIFDRMPQIEVAVGSQVTVLVLRILAPLTTQDEALLQTFADTHRIQFWLQPKGPETAYPFYPLDAPALSYELPAFHLTMPYRPTEFTQVNPLVNQAMVKQAIDLLDPQPHERIADMFCGLGNFTLPIARCGAQVLGIEGSQELVTRALENATYNGLTDLTDFQVTNLFDLTPESFSQLGPFDKMLIDPPREGAAELVRALGLTAPTRIVYVSCNPATLARDTAILVHEKGYTLKAAGIINMFPQTSHVESIALFEKPTF